MVLPDSVTSIGSDAFLHNTGDPALTGSRVMVLTNNEPLLACNDRNENYQVFLRNIGKNGAKISGLGDRTYTGRAIQPAPAVKLGTVKLKKGTDYTVSYSKNKSIGTAKVTITGIGAYNGKIAGTFRILPKKTSVTSLKRGKKSFRAAWKKTSGSVTRYQIQYSTSKKFASKSTKTKSIKSNKAAVKKLKARKKYYVRVRSFKSVSGKRYYSPWSGVKTVRVK